MTREECIDWLCRLRADLNNGIIFTPWNKEFTEALTGILEQEPSGDLIQRQAVLDETYLWSKDEFLRVTNPFDYLRKRIDSLSPVTPHKIGYWIKVIDEVDSLGNETWHHRCSICGNDASGWGKYKYCPDCGAKMQAKSDHKCHNCKHYTSGERDGNCDSYICKHYSGWESEDKE